MSERTPTELLATFVLGDAERTAAAAREISQRGLWSNTVRLAALWRVLPLVRSRVRAEAPDIGADATRELAGLGAGAAAQSGLVCKRALDALDALEAAGVRAAVFKGVASIAWLHGQPAARMVQDADILLERADLDRAGPALRAAGFAPDIDIDLDSWSRVLEDRVYAAHDFLNFADEDGVKLDLHYALRTPHPDQFQPSDILARSQPRALLGRSIRCVSAEDAMLLGAHHAVRERLVPQTAVKDFADLAAWLAIDPRPWSTETLLGRARACGMNRSLLAALTVLAELDAGGPARSVAAEAARASSAEDRASAERLAGLFHLQVREGAASDVVVGMGSMTPALLRRFVVSRVRMLTDPVYRAHKFPGTGGPAPLAQRVRLLARSLVRLTPRRLGMYRALARETRRYIGDGEQR